MVYTPSDVPRSVLFQSAHAAGKLVGTAVGRPIGTIVGAADDVGDSVVGIKVVLGDEVG